MNDTIKYYIDNFKEYVDSTKDIDMTELYIDFLANIKGSDILDVGSGSLRDSLYFRDLGFNVSCLDPVVNFYNLALENNFEAYNQCITQINLSNQFDGIWACASLLHVDSTLINKAFYKCHKALRNNGVMFCSFKTSESSDVKDNRYFNYLSIDKLKEICITNKFSIIEIKESSDKLNRGNNWISVIIRKMTL